MARAAPGPSDGHGRAPAGPAAASERPGTDIVEAVLASLPELTSGRLDATTWGLVLEGSVRLRIPVAIELGGRGCVLQSFLLRAPHGGTVDGSADLHRVLLRKNRSTLWVTLCLDSDDDVVMRARIPAAALSEAALQEALGEILVIGDQSFEGLVHLAYPGVFPSLSSGASPPPWLRGGGTEGIHPGADAGS